MGYAIVGQALLDEGSILTDKIEIFYNDRRTALFVFHVALRLRLSQRFRVKTALSQTKFGFTLEQLGWERLYKMIGPLPDRRKDIAFRFLLRRRPRGALRSVGKSKQLLLTLLKEHPSTIRDLCYHAELSGSTVKRHLSDLRANGLVSVIGRNSHSVSGKNKSAYLWGLVRK